MHKKVGKTLTLCGLCKKQRTLVESHLIPKSIYKIIVNKSLSRSPVLSIGRKSVKTSRQVKSHFLCRPCEEILSTNGETPPKPNLSFWFVPTIITSAFVEKILEFQVCLPKKT